MSKSLTSNGMGCGPTVKKQFRSVVYYQELGWMISVSSQGHQAMVGDGLEGVPGCGGMGKNFFLGIAGCPGMVGKKFGGLVGYPGTGKSSFCSGRGYEATGATFFGRSSLYCAAGKNPFNQNQS